MAHIRLLSVNDRIHWLRLAIVGVALLSAVAYRIYAPRLGLTPNVELVTMTAFLAASLLRTRWTVLVPLVAVALSDLVLGNTFLLAFTWGAWALIGLGALLIRRLTANDAENAAIKPDLSAIESGGQPIRRSATTTSVWRRLAVALGFAVGSTAFFFLFTNFGVWATTGWYPHTWDGLVTTYAMGVPFARPQLFANLIALPVAAVVVLLVERTERICVERATVLAKSAPAAVTKTG